MEKKFNFQLVFFEPKSQFRCIFVGSTDLTPTELFYHYVKALHNAFPDSKLSIENFNYAPLNSENYGTQKKT